MGSGLSECNSCCWAALSRWKRGGCHLRRSALKGLPEKGFPFFRTFPFLSLRSFTFFAIVFGTSSVVLNSLLVLHFALNAWPHSQSLWCQSTNVCCLLFTLVFVPANLVSVWLYLNTFISFFFCCFWAPNGSVSNSILATRNRTVCLARQRCTKRVSRSRVH